MTVKRPKSGKGLTLVEIMAAMSILSVAVIGTCGYRYYAALDARKAGMRKTASDIALLLTESWRGVQGDETFDPTACFGSDLAISTIAEGSVEPDDESFTLLGGYTVVVHGTTYVAVLSWKDIGSGLRALSVAAGWPQTNQAAAKTVAAERSFKLVTYTSS
jgi:prepilin-type N-terminal cleavage/methylation domain-containing protein